MTTEKPDSPLLYEEDALAFPPRRQFPLYIHQFFSYLSPRDEQVRANRSNSLKERATFFDAAYNILAEQIVTACSARLIRVRLRALPYQNEKKDRKTARRHFQSDKRSSGR